MNEKMLLFLVCLFSIASVCAFEFGIGLGELTFTQLDTNAIKLDLNIRYSTITGRQYLKTGGVATSLATGAIGATDANTLMLSIRIIQVTENSCDWKLDFDGNVMDVAGVGDYNYWSTGSGKQLGIFFVKTGLGAKQDCYIKGELLEGK